MAGIYGHALSEGTIGNISVRNRIYFAPHGHPTWLLAQDRAPNEEFNAYMEARAAGGVGLLFHSLPALPNVQFGRHCPYESRTIPAFQRLADRVHRHDSRIFAQLSVFVREPRWGPRTPAAPTLAPSAQTRSDGRSVSREATVADLEHIVEAFEVCARNLRDAGYDGIELHAAHGLFVAQFLSPLFNRRLDDYGGTAANRARFVRELLLALRRGFGQSGAVGIRLNCDEMVEGGLLSSDAKELLTLLETQELIDFADLDIALEPQQMDLAMPTYLAEPLPYVNHVADVGQVLRGTPILSTLGRVRDMVTADAAIESGIVDFVGMARGLIAEPDIVRNAIRGLERRSRRCIGANHCVAGTQDGLWGCAINPRTGRESDPPLAGSHTSEHRRVLVVGGGPAGMEAARSAALLGQEVVLVEAGAALGGQLRLWSMLPGREELAESIDWWADQLVELGVSVELGTLATPSLCASFEPDVVINASGARYVRDPEVVGIPGADLPHVRTLEEVLSGPLEINRSRIVVVDDEGTNAGIGISEAMARAGAQVDLLTRFDRPAEHQTATWETLTVVPRACAAGVTIRPHLRTERISEDALHVVDLWTGERSGIDRPDHVVLVAARRSRTWWGPPISAVQDLSVGDAFSPRGLREATFEGYQAAQLIGRADIGSTVDAFWRSLDVR